MIRTDRTLHQVNVARWTRDEAHLVATFDLAANQRPDLFEPYLIRLADAEQVERSQVAIMRQALRTTFAIRYPNRHAKPDAEPEQW